MDSPPPADQATEDARHCRLVLMDLMDMAHGVARVMHRHVTAPAEAAPQAAPASAPPAPVIPPLAAAASFDRACRNIRQTVMLVEQVGRPKPPASRPGAHRIAARKRIIREVEDVIQRTAHGPRAERLYAELAERLDAPDLEEELDTRQVAEIVTDLCRDLGLAHTEGNHPWKRRRPADIAALRAVAARPPGAGFAATPMRPVRERTGGDPAGGAAGSRPPDRPAGVAAGDLDAAELDAPDLDGSDLEAPDLEAPDLEAPDLDAPDLDAPDLDAPDLEAPDLKTPSPDAPDPKAPDFEAPDFEAPDFEAPDLGAPELEAADPEAPDLDTPDRRPPDFCDYEPGARGWIPPDRVAPRTAVPDITRPKGTASFRGG